MSIGRGPSTDWSSKCLIPLMLIYEPLNSTQMKPMTDKMWKICEMVEKCEKAEAEEKYTA